MKRKWRVLGWALGAVLLLALVAVAAGWWVARRALPEYDGTTSLPELAQEVVVERDEWGTPRIRAGSLEDLLTAQGYVAAQDRLWQMDVLRRVAAGELSEIFGPATLALDRENRTLGMRAAAARAAEEMDAETRGWLEAYARGVNRYIEERRGRLPWEFVALRYEPRPWAPADTALIGAYMYRTLTLRWRTELNRAKVTALVGPERARELYVDTSPLDRYLVGQATERPVRPSPLPRRAAATEAAASAALALLEQFDAETLLAGSNNWVVDGRHTASRRPLLANDMHLPHGVPSIWYLAQLEAPGVRVKGFTLPGVPLVIVGHNEHLAWGFTNNGADVADLYEEKFHPEDPQRYLVNGEWRPAEIRREVIKVKGQSDDVAEVVVTRHGPIVHREDGRAYALRWVATERGALGFGYPRLGLARNWEEFRAALRRVPGPAQNVVYADAAGNIGYAVGSWIPLRRAGDGSVPAPGETDAHEWTGYIPFDELPAVLNPPEGRLATANSRVAGPGYRHHLTAEWVSPYRTARIYELLEQGGNFRPEDFLAMQTDIRSPLVVFLAEQMTRAAERHPPADAWLRELLARLGEWDGQATADSPEAALVEYTRRELMRRLLRPHLGEGMNLYRWLSSTTFLHNVLDERPPHWLPPETADYDALLVAAAETAAAQLAQETGSAGPAAWRWGRFNHLDMLHPIGRSGLLRRLLSFPPVEQAGTRTTVKQTASGGGVSQRFVADLADWDNSLMNITTGQSGQWLSPHYRDQFPAWQEGRGIASPFTDAAWEGARRRTLRLVPQ